MDTKIGHRIRQERQSQQLPREELAKALGKSVDLIGKIERGERQISVHDLARIAQVLGRPSDFFLCEVDLPGADRDLDELIASVSLNPRDAAELRRLPRVRTKEAILSLVSALEATRYGLLRNLAWESETDVELDGTCRRWEHRRIAVLDRTLETLTLRNFRSRDLRPRTLADFSRQFILEDCSANGREVVPGPIHILGNVVWHSIAFRPPLARGEVADLYYEESCKRFYVMSHEQLQRLITNGQWLPGEPRERHGVPTDVPTDSLRRKITFPPGYEVEDVALEVSVEMMPLRDERERLIREDCLSQRKVHGRRVLELVVPRPVVGAAYRIIWRPMSESAYQALVKQGRAETGGRGA